MTVEERRTYRKDNAIKMDENQDYKKLVHLLLNTTVIWSFKLDKI